MNVSYMSFGESEFHRIGKLMADRDSFLLLFEIARSVKPPNLVRLCGTFRASAETVHETFDQLESLGMAVRRHGTYAATSFGISALEFVEDVANKFTPAPQTARTAMRFVKMAQIEYQVAATNNSVRSTFASGASAATTVAAPSKPGPSATDANAASVAAESHIENASRSHNYL